MKNTTWIGSKENNLNTTNELNSELESTNSPVFYGRTYNEAVPFNQNNFNAFQNILDQRNALLESVKPFHQK